MTRLGLAVTVLAAVAGCTGATLEDEWNVTLRQLEGLPLGNRSGPLLSS